MFRFTKGLITAIILFGAMVLMSAQIAIPQQSPPPMVIEPADADAFREIIETTIPPRYNGAIIRWYTSILQRQQAKIAEAAKAEKKE